MSYLRRSTALVQQVALYNIQCIIYAILWRQVVLNFFLLAQEEVETFGGQFVVG